MLKVLVTGRGGSGKSTLVALLARKLREEGGVLVVDTDESNMGLPVLLGLQRPSLTLMEALGGKDRIRERLKQFFKNEEVAFFEDGLTLEGLPREALSGSDGLWFVSVGKEEHAMEGCACPMGLLGRDFLKRFAGEGLWVLVDTEAGVEHFGRGLVSVVDVVLYVAEPALESLLLLEKAKRMSEEAGKTFLVVANKVRGDLRGKFVEMLEGKGASPVAVIPYWEAIIMADLMGSSLQEVPEGVEDLVDALKGFRG